MQHFWIVGTDTDVGKTAVTTLLMRQFQRQNLRVTPFKPVQTGEVHENDHSYYYDTTVYEKYSLQVLRTESLNGYSFKEAASPHFAAQLEVQQINVHYLLQQIQVLQQSNDMVICEGAGGLFVPLDLQRKITLLDVIVQSKLPVVLVTRTTLGTINHTILTIEALHARNIDILGIVFNGNSGSLIEQDTMKTILQFHDLPYAIIPQFQEIGQLVDYSISHTSLFERLVNDETSVN